MLFIRGVAQNTKLLEITLIRNVKVQEQYGDNTKHCIYVISIYTKNTKKITGGMIRIFKLYIPINIESE